jgi:hypothetical protein
MFVVVVVVNVIVNVIPNGIANVIGFFIVVVLNIQHKNLITNSNHHLGVGPELLFSGSRNRTMLLFLLLMFIIIVVLNI